MLHPVEVVLFKGKRETILLPYLHGKNSLLTYMGEKNWDQPMWLLKHMPPIGGICPRRERGWRRVLKKEDKIQIIGTYTTLPTSSPSHPLKCLVPLSLHPWSVPFQLTHSGAYHWLLQCDTVIICGSRSIALVALQYGLLQQHDSAVITSPIRLKLIDFLTLESVSIQHFLVTKEHI